MSNKTTKSRKVKPLKTSSKASSPPLTRSDVAELLGCSEPTVRRLEGSDLHPTVGTDGVHRFDLPEVLHVRRARAARVDGSKQGELDARVFELLDAGKGVREIVTTLRLPVDSVLKLVAQWQEAGRQDVVVPPACKAELQQCLGVFADAAELVQRVRAISDENDRLPEYRSNTQNRISDVIVTIGAAAATNAELARVLPDLRAALDADTVEILDRAFESTMQQPTVDRSASP